MLLYTCPAKTVGGAMPFVQHPCGAAAKALTDAGHRFDVETVAGFKALPPTRRGKRERIRELTGQEDVPVLVTDDGTAVAGHREIIAWAGANPA